MSVLEENQAPAMSYRSWTILILYIPVTLLAMNTEGISNFVVHLSVVDITLRTMQGTVSSHRSCVQQRSHPVPRMQQSLVARLRAWLIGPMTQHRNSPLLATVHPLKTGKLRCVRDTPGRFPLTFSARQVSTKFPLQNINRKWKMIIDSLRDSKVYVYYHF